MSAPAPAAPRVGVLIATGGMLYAVVWGSIRFAIAGSPPAAIGSLLLLCGAFLLARGTGRITRVRAALCCLLAVGGIDAALAASAGRIDVADNWSTPAIAAVALLLILRGRQLVAGATLGGQIALLWIVGGFARLEDLGVLTTVLTLAVVTAAGRVLDWYSAQMRHYTETERDALEWRIAQDAYQLAHQQRIEQTGVLAGAMLQRIVAGEGRLDQQDRAECRLLHQAIRDETRGRLLLDDAVREQVRAHRRRGATVQLLDDGHLNRLEPAALARLQHDIAEMIAPLTSDRIIIRSGTKLGLDTVTVVATTVDPVAAALGQDDDEQVDLWHEFTVPADPRLVDTIR